MEKSEKSVLIAKLDRFIRKYYKNQLIRGVLYSIGLILGSYLVLTVVEYYAHFSTGLRATLFYGMLAATAVIVGLLIVGPLFRLYHLGKQISHKTAAQIIGNHFADVQDKLLNTLQLQEQLRFGDREDLLIASIDQKTRELQPVPFNAAIDFSKNRKYLKYAIPPVLVLVVLVFAAPSILSEGTDRLIRHNTYFEKKSLFQFSILNKTLEVAEQEDFVLELELSGQAFPEKAYIELNGELYQLKKKDNTHFSHEFKNVQKDQDFKLYAEEFYSDEFTLKTLPNPLVLNFDVDLKFPSYIKRKNEVIKNTGDLVIPEGTRVSWQFKTQNTDVLRMRFQDKVLDLSPAGALFTYGQAFKTGSPYTISTSNQFMQSRDSITYSIRVVRDQHPTISMEEKRDSLSTKRMYFKGSVQDDYGFKKLHFNYRFLSEDSTGTRMPMRTEDISINTGLNQDQFFHIWDLQTLDINAGDKIEYYFEVWDNDGVNGSKSSRTPMKLFEAPSVSDLEDKADKANEDIKEELEKSLDEARDLQKDLAKLQKELLEKKNLSWQEKKKLENVLERQQALQQRIEKVQEKNSKKNSEQEEYREFAPELKEKEQELQKLFEDIMTDEMKELFKELQKLVEEMNKDKIQEKLEDIKLSNEDIEKELDRSLEIFKQMEVSMKMEQIAEKLDKLAEEQKKLAEETKEKEKDAETLKEEQDKLNEKFDELKKEMEELKKKNDELENKHNMEDFKEQEESIEKEMEKSSEQLEDKNTKKASESQQNAAEQMQQMSQQMESMMAAAAEESVKEDMQALRALLENLIELSFNQEDLMAELGTLDVNNPKYVSATQEQKKLKDDAKMIEDSLFALSKRVSQLSSVINREISSINRNMDNAIDNLADRRTGNATAKQQEVMTSLNNLALLLDEALQQMQAQANSMSGNSSCTKPGGKGGKKPSMQKMKSMQESLQKQLEQMKGQCDKPGGAKKGGGTPGMSEGLAKLAAQQSAIRRELEKMGQEMNKDGSGNGNELNKIAQKMEQNEKDIVNKDITIETLERQKDIMTRLLKSEKAEREREMDNKRESKEANNVTFSNPEEYFEYNRKKEREVELLNTVPPALKPYYKNKVTQYFNEFED